MADNKKYKLTIIAPDRVFFQEDVDFLELTTSEGDIGIYKNHIPLTAVVMPGVVKIHQDGNVRKAALHSGFITIFQDEVKIMAEIVEWPEEIDINRANEAKIRAERKLKEGGSGSQLRRAEIALKKSIVRIEAKK